MINNEPITLNDLLHFTDDQVDNVRIRLCSPPSVNKDDDPIEWYKTNPDLVATTWTLWRPGKRAMFSSGNIVIGLCRLNDDPDRWLLVTVKTITNVTGQIDGVGYAGDEWGEYKKYCGRVIVRFHRDGRYLTLKGDKLDRFAVEQILPDQYDDDHFPGYDRVMLSWKQLKRILDRHLDDWCNALNNQKGVYVITDKKTGKLYVGSATSDKGMLLKRWSDYARDGHGGDVELKELVTEHGFEYVQENFQYTLLENYNGREDDQRILNRETWWKEVLCTRQFGYNAN